MSGANEEELDINLVLFEEQLDTGCKSAHSPLFVFHQSSQVHLYWTSYETIINISKDE